MYGRGAKALTTEINKIVDEPITEADAQTIIAGISEAFPVAWEWLKDNSKRAIAEEKVENVFGRFRYFTGVGTLSKKEQAAAEREAKNSPIQGCVADLLAQAGYQLYHGLNRLEREGLGLDMKILLPIHDAFLFEVKYEDIGSACTFIESCMSTYNCLPESDRHLNIDIEIMEHSWGDKSYPSPEKFYEAMAA